MTAIDIPDCPPVVGWTATTYANPSGHRGTLYSPLDGAPVSVLLMDGTDGTVELWGGNDFLTKDEGASLGRLLVALLAQKSGVKHGTANGYRNGCRCADCRAAKQEYRVEVRARQRRNLDRAGIAVPDGIKHGTSAYSNWGCRCEVCVEDKRRTDRERNAKRSAASRRGVA